jgi:Holliday junction resolvase RusA-like endonuclease
VLTVFIQMPGAPVAKGRPRFAKGRAYTPAETAAYEKALAWAALAAMAGRKPLDGPLDVGVFVFIAPPASWSDKRKALALSGLILPTKRPDGDNYLKAALDSLNGVVWHDDAQATDIRVRKRYRAEPGLFITVQQMIGEPA